MWKSKFKFISIVKPKYLIFMHCGIEILFKKTLVCGKGLFSLGCIIRKLDLEGCLTLIQILLCFSKDRLYFGKSLISTYPDVQEGVLIGKSPFQDGAMMKNTPTILS